MQTLEKDEESVPLGGRETAELLIQLQNVEILGFIEGGVLEQFRSYRCDRHHGTACPCLEGGLYNAVLSDLQIYGEPISATSESCLTFMRCREGAVVSWVSDVIPVERGIHLFTP